MQCQARNSTPLYDCCLHVPLVGEGGLRYCGEDTCENTNPTSFPGPDVALAYPEAMQMSRQLHWATRFEWARKLTILFPFHAMQIDTDLHAHERSPWLREVGGSCFEPRLQRLGPLHLPLPH